MVLKTDPPPRSMHRRMMESWRARAPDIASGASSQRRVLPSTSVNKNAVSDLAEPDTELKLPPSAEVLHRPPPQGPLERRNWAARPALVSTPKPAEERLFRIRMRL